MFLFLKLVTDEISVINCDIDMLLIACFCQFVDVQDPYAIVVLMQNDLVVVDLTTPG